MALLQTSRAPVPAPVPGAAPAVPEAPDDTGARDAVVVPVGGVEEVDLAADQLYALPPERFLSARGGIAERLRAAGCHEEAEAVRALKRPTRTAWALNQVARTHPDAVAALLDAGAALVAARADGASGGRLRQAQRAWRRELDATVVRAREVMEAARMPSSAQAVALAAVLEVAAVDPLVGDELRRGRLTGGPGAVAVDGVHTTAAVQPEPDLHLEPRPTAEGRERHRREERERLAVELEAATAELIALRRQGEEAAAACDRAEMAVESIRIQLGREEERARKAAIDFHRAEREVRGAVRRVRQLQERVANLDDVRAPLRRPRRA